MINSLKIHERRIRESSEDYSDIYKRTGELPGTGRKKISYSYGAVKAIVGGKTPDEVRKELMLNVIS